MPSQRPPVVLDRAIEMVEGKGVRGVLHRVGGHDVGVVAVGMGGHEVALECDSDGQIVKTMGRLITSDPDDPDGRLAVAMGREFDHGATSRVSLD